MSNTAIANYTFPATNTQIRTVTIDGALWFVATDVCKVLGHTNTAKAVLVVAFDEVQCRALSEFDPNLAAQAKGRGGFRPTTSVTLVSESGLYKLIMRSDLSTAKPFQDWVTRTVLPAIRKDGMYVMGEEKVATGEMNEEELILKAYGLLQAKVEPLY